MDSAYVLALIDALAGRRVAVIGDVVADEFVYGRVARVSREAPVLILEYDSTQIVPGAAGNAANNVATLGGRVTLVAVVGRDEPGRRLIGALHPRVHRGRILRAANHTTPVKTRILAGGIHSAKQQVVRIDRAVMPVSDARSRAAFERAALQSAVDADAVLVSDYGSDLVTPALVSKMRAAILRKERPVPILIDTRYRLLSYRGFTACTPNESEVEHALGFKIGSDTRRLEEAGASLLKQLQVKAVLITRGRDGMALFVAGEEPVHIPIFGTDEIADVTGAGDTVIAVFTLALAVGANFMEAARLSNYAGGIVVMKRGTATLSAEELRQAVMLDQNPA